VEVLYLGQRLWDEKYVRDPEMRCNHAPAAELLEEAWTGLPTAAILAAWDFNPTECPDAMSMSTTIMGSSNP
jgi:hypothetical protein